MLRSSNPLPAVCGRVCPQEVQCEEQCSVGIRFKPVAIGYLERFVADWEMQQAPREISNKLDRAEKVAIIGSGPAGLVCAGELARLGYPVTIFEALHAPGGVLRYGIPEFRLPKDVLDWEIDQLRKLGVEIQCNVIIGKTITMDELMGEMGYSAVFIGTGAGLPTFMGIPGENLNGVYSANEFLTRVNLMHANDFPNADTPVMVGKRVAVIGAGNTAMDTVRTALRVGAEQGLIVYRRSDKEMTARVEEHQHAIEEGVEFHWLTNPVEVLGDEDGWVTGLKCIRMQLGEPDASGRARPIPIKGSEFVMPGRQCRAIDRQQAQPLAVADHQGSRVQQMGLPGRPGRSSETSRDHVFAGGDAVTGAATVILAAGAGKDAATRCTPICAARGCLRARPKQK